MAKSTPNALPLGTVIHSPSHAYVIKQVLGAGGFGITYKVTTTITEGNIRVTVPMAIKEFFLSEMSDRDHTSQSVTYSAPVAAKVEGARKDFISEARRLKGLAGKHPGIICVNETIEANNTAYYVMEYLDGEDLAAVIRNRGAFAENDALTILEPVVDAVKMLHSHKITHLDIKPANILLATGVDGRNRPVLIDFGLSKHYDENDRPTSTINTQGCSDGFAPIEQYRGLTTFSPKADVYALGATLYTLIVGHRPPVADQVIMTNIDRDLALRRVSESTRRAILRAMAYRSIDRTPTVADLAESLYGIHINLENDEPIDFGHFATADDGRTVCKDTSSFDERSHAPKPKPRQVRDVPSESGFAKNFVLWLGGLGAFSACLQFFFG